MPIKICGVHIFRMITTKHKRYNPHDKYVVVVLPVYTKDE